MQQHATLPNTSASHISRRGILGALPAFFLVAACSRGAGKPDENWTTFGSSTETIDHSVWDKILKTYGHTSPDGINRIDYAGIKSGAMKDLDGYIQALEATAISEYSRDEQFAFWVNLYNAATVRVIVENYPLASIRDIGLLGQGPWKDNILKVAGKDLALDDIEHTILRPIWQDVRIHYAVNCASIGCPNLALEAWTADRLEDMLDAAATAYVNHPRGFADDNGGLKASSIYEWYQDDWGTDLDVIEHARKYANPETLKLLQSHQSIDSYDYDWSLNEFKS